MYKFKASKYKNAFTTNAKKEECITDLSVETPVTFGNHAAASGKLVAFCVGLASSGKIMAFDINKNGRLGSGPSLNAHNDAITDLKFSPFNHCRLATASADNTVKIWDLPEDGITDTYSDAPVETLSGFDQRPESIAFHPIAEDTLAVASGSMIFIYNLADRKKIFELDTGKDLIQCISWKKNGIYIAVTTKDRHLIICDPRSGKIISSGEAHGNHKESRVVWAGDTDKVFTTGFSNNRQKELKIWDVSGEKPKCVQTQDFGSGTGILIPFYDEDTGMMFVAAKGDSQISFLEYSENKNPPLSLVTQQLLPNQTKGMCMVSKLGVKAGECEVNRLFQLTQKMLVPVPWVVPRKTLRDFPSDLFPDTASDQPGLSAEQWIAGENGMRNRTSLEPSKRKPLRLGSTDDTKPSTTKQTNGAAGEEPVRKPTPKPVPKESPKEPAKTTVKEPEPVAAAVASKPKNAPFSGVRSSKFRHWKCTIGHPSSHVTNVEPISLTVSTSSDALRCNHLYAAVPIKGPGGQIAIIKLSAPGRMNDENSLILQNSKVVTDLQWNPFNQSKLVVSLENGRIKIWNIPPNKFGEILEEPELQYQDHNYKPMVLSFHPLAENIIASGDVESNILIWDTATGGTYHELSCDSGEIMSLAWSQCGKFIAASTKEKKLLIFEPRKSNKPIQMGPGPTGTRSSRMTWVCNDKFIAVSGFDHLSGRIISLHATKDLASGPVSSEYYDNSPSVLMSHYDQESSTLFCVSKGDTTMQSLEISENEAPHLFRIATFSSDVPFQGISFLSKKNIDVKKVEFAQAWCLTKTTLQPMSFTVPRVKMEYFQDDLFPPTSVTWEKTLSGSEWVKGTNKTPRKLDLKPTGMKPLSQAPPEEVKQKKYESYDASTYKTDEQKKDELLEAMSGKLDLDKGLEQDTMEGVDEDEWDDY